MQLTPDAILEAAMNLPEGERLDLAVRLLDTVPPGIMSIDDPGLIAELDRRSADDSGAIPWSDLKNE
jgi:hypothetical protein